MTQAFDQYRESYGDVVQGSIDFSGLEHSFFMRAKANVLFDILASRDASQDTSGLEYLDVGCGIGAFLPYVQDRFHATHGCDISGDSIEKAKELNGTANFRLYDGKRLPYEDASFDVLTTVCVVHHVPAAQWPAYFAEMRRVLKPGGIACVIEHNPLNPLTRLAVARCEFDHDAELLTHWKTEKLFKGAGFKKQNTLHFLFLPTEHKFAQAFERRITKLPLGAQYVGYAEA